MLRKKDEQDVEMIFEIFDERIFLNISEEKSSQKIPQLFCSTLRIGSMLQAVCLIFSGFIT